MVLFEASIILLSVVFLLILTKVDEKYLSKYIIIFVGILLFQYFTQALWVVGGMEKWAYLYLGVSWVITLGRASMVIVSIALVDLYFPQQSERAKFWLYLIPIVVLGIIGEVISTSTGTIRYHQELINILSGIKLVGQVPIEALLYIPIFMIFVLSFLKYWEKNLWGKTKRINKLKRRKRK